MRYKKGGKFTDLKINTLMLPDFRKKKKKKKKSVIKPILVVDQRVGVASPKSDHSISKMSQISNISMFGVDLEKKKTEFLNDLYQTKLGGKRSLIGLVKELLRQAERAGAEVTNGELFVWIFFIREFLFIFFRGEEQYWRTV